MARFSLNSIGVNKYNLKTFKDGSSNMGKELVVFLEAYAYMMSLPVYDVTSVYVRLFSVIWGSYPVGVVPRRR